MRVVGLAVGIARINALFHIHVQFSARLFPDLPEVLRALLIQINQGHIALKGEVADSVRRVN